MNVITVKRLIFAGLAAALIWPAWYLTDLPDTTPLKDANPTAWAIRTYREEQVRKKGGKPQSMAEWRNMDDISAHLWHAVVLSEDDTFFFHNGFDVQQVKNAARINWERKKFAFGASTITQQLARTLYLSPDKNLFRKVKEALITRKLEQGLKKKRILELYLNTVEWGPNVYGAEAAAQFYFKKSAWELSPNEAIALASILPSPRKWNPHKEDGFMGKRKAILYDRMVRANYLEPEVSPDVTYTQDVAEGEGVPPLTLEQPIFGTPTPSEPEVKVGVEEAWDSTTR